MGLFSSGGGPTTYNPQQIIRAQAQANQINTYTPTGNQIYGTVGPNGQFVPRTGQNQTATQIQQTPYQQQMQGITEGTATNLANALSPQASNLQALDTSGLPGMVAGLDMSKIRSLPGMEDFSADADKVTQATYDRLSNLLRPEFDLQERRMNTSLADKGLPFSGEAFGTAQGRFSDARNRAFSDIANQAVLAGRQEQQRLFGNTLASRGAEVQDQLNSAGLAAQARQQGFGEQKTIRDQQLNELAGLLGGSYQPSPLSQFPGAQPLDATGAFSIAQSGNNANYAAQQAQQAALMNGLFGLGAAGISSGGFGLF